jgi:uncharacterized caspase-like protein
MLHAIAVGINKYADRNVSGLQYASADAKAFAQLISERIEPEDRKVLLILDEQATKRNVFVAVGEDLARIVRQEDIVVLYFAGHGSPETEAGPDQASRYLVMHDTEYENIYATGVDLERDLPRWFKRLTTPRLILLFLDACFSGRAGGRTFEGPRLSSVRADYRGRIRLRGLALGEGRLMISACDDDQVAREDAKLSHGVFTHFLLEALDRPRTNKTMSISQLYDELVSSVSTYTQGRQIPVMNGRSRSAHLPTFGLNSR